MISKCYLLITIGETKQIGGRWIEKQKEKPIVNLELGGYCPLKSKNLSEQGNTRNPKHVHSYRMSTNVSDYRFRACAARPAVATWGTLLP